MKNKIISIVMIGELFWYSGMNNTAHEEITLDDAESFFTGVYNAHRKGKKLQDYFEKLYYNKKKKKNLKINTLQLATVDPAKLAFYSHFIGEEKDNSLIFFVFKKLAEEYLSLPSSKRVELTLIKDKAALLSVPLSLVKGELEPSDPEHFLAESPPATIWKEYSGEGTDFNILDAVFSSASHEQQERYKELLKNPPTRRTLEPNFQERKKFPLNQPKRVRMEGVPPEVEDSSTYFYTLTSVQKLKYLGLPAAVITVLALYMYRNPNNFITQRMIKPLMNLPSRVLNSPVGQRAIVRLKAIAQWLMRRRAAGAA